MESDRRYAFKLRWGNDRSWPAADVDGPAAEVKLPVSGMTSGAVGDDANVGHFGGPNWHRDWHPTQ